MRKALVLLLVALAGQVALGLHERGVHAAWAGLASPPPADLAPLLALGDRQLYYRGAAFALQNTGDEGGRVTPLTDYDYGRLGAWLAMLDDLDPEADYLPTLAGFYFAQTPDPGALRRVVAYLIERGARAPGRNWRWLAQAVYLARHRLHDQALALEAARHLARLAGTEAPLWVRQMPAFVLADVGEREAARDLLEAILESDRDLAPDEVAFMRHFIDHQLAPPTS